MHVENPDGYEEAPFCLFLSSWNAFCFSLFILLSGVFSTMFRSSDGVPNHGKKELNAFLVKYDVR